MAQALVVTGWIFLGLQVLLLILQRIRASMVFGGVGFVLNIAGALVAWVL